MAKVLVIDDDDTMRRLIRTVLERRGHEVSEARDGAEGLARFDELRPDLLVTDIVMPGTGGVELVTRLHQRQPPPRVLVVSGRQIEFDENLRAMADSGLVKFVRKPFLPAELAAAVQTLLG